MAVGVAGADGLAAATRSAAAPLEVVARRLPRPGVAWVVGAGAVTAMAGVLLNLLLGLSRVLLAMSRRADMPAALARIDGRQGSPRRAVIAVGTLIAALVTLGSIRTTWSFSAFTVLVYYAHEPGGAQAPARAAPLPALGARPRARVLPRARLLGRAHIWAAGLGLIALGLLWHHVARRRRSP